MSRPPPLPRLLVVDLPLALFIAVGLAGTVGVSDDLDVLRFNLLGWVGMPLAVLYFGARALYPKWPEHSPRVARTTVAALAIMFTSGVVPLVNAVTSDRRTVKRTVQSSLGVATRDVQRGGLGWVFKTRRL